MMLNCLERCVTVNKNNNDHDVLSNGYISLDVDGQLSFHPQNVLFAHVFMLVNKILLLLNTCHSYQELPGFPRSSNSITTPIHVCHSLPTNLHTKVSTCVQGSPHLGHHH